MATTPALIPPTAPSVPEIDQRPGGYTAETGEGLQAVFVSRSLVYGIDFVRYSVELKYAPLRGAFMLVTVNGKVLLRDVDFVVQDTALDLSLYFTNTYTPQAGDKISVQYLGAYTEDTVQETPQYSEVTERFVATAGQLEYVLSDPSVYGTSVHVYLNGVRLTEGAVGSGEYTISRVEGAPVKVLLNAGVTVEAGWILLADYTVENTAAVAPPVPTPGALALDAVSVAGTLTVGSIAAGGVTLTAEDIAALKLLLPA